MKSKPDILSRLKSERSNNVLKLIEWSMADFNEMKDTYVKAKEVAADSSDTNAIEILDEKISQLEEALMLKNQTKDISI